MNQQIAQWYEQQTGLNAKRGGQRIEKIEQFINTHGVGLNDVVINVRDINTRKHSYRPLAPNPNRAKIGSTTHSTTKSTEYYIELR